MKPGLVPGFFMGIMGVPETFVIDKPLRGAVAPRGLQLE